MLGSGTPGEGGGSERLAHRVTGNISKIAQPIEEPQYVQYGTINADTDSSGPFLYLLKG